MKIEKSGFYGLSGSMVACFERKDINLPRVVGIFYGYNHLDHKHNIMKAFTPDGIEYIKGLVAT